MTSLPVVDGSTRLAQPAWPSAPALDDAASERLRLYTDRGVPALIAEVLVRRGYDTPEYAAIALGGTLADHRVAPEALPDLRRAVALTVQAIAEGRPMVVRGDFDADGVCSTAVLVRGLVRAGAVVTWHVPHRQREGRDFTAAQARALAPRGGVLLCVDHGTNAPDALVAAQESGADVIVLDHHRPQALTPREVLCINPHRPDCSYAAPDICATMIAWHFLRGVSEAMGQDASVVDWAGELAAIATLADSMPLVGENRALVRTVMPQLPSTRLPGLRALLRVARLGDRPTLTARDVVFDLVPHLNAAGRVGDARDAVRLLISEDPLEVLRCSALLGTLNDHRRATEERVLAGAWRKAQAVPLDQPGIVLRGNGWHPGVVSIVAARVAERCGRPTLVLVPEGAVWRGSCRAGRTGVDVFGAIQACARHLTAWGGHREAVGLTVPDAGLEAFETAFLDSLAVQAAAGGRSLRRRLPDVTGVLTQLPDELAGWLTHMGPFGPGFEAPRVVMSGHCGVLDRVGLHRTHLDGVLSMASGQQVAIWGPRLADEYPPELLRGVPIDVMGSLDLHRGRVRLVVEALRPCSTASPAA
ncbi:MAG: DHH family phosphoesterase [Gemmatimonadaceae bacterium]|nr:DHH family phosphoesterase [Gemmatimonadaceae bacterium]